MSSSQKRKILNLCLSYPQDNSAASELEDAIYASINPPTAAIQAGRAIPLPAGRFVIQKILAQLPADWQPDLISISSSLALTERPPIPIGLVQLNCPAVMKLTDSHHMARPLQTLIAYSQAVGCNYHWTTYNRQHIPFYRAAGLANVFWMPGAINIAAPKILLNPESQKPYDLLFLGTRGDSHPYRDSLLASLEQSGIPVTVKRLPYQESLQAYTKAKIVFNCSLNGDFNRRVYETLMVGGFLLTDCLAPTSGLPLIFNAGQDLECYHSQAELLEKVQFYLAHPEQAQSIARQGQQTFLKDFHPELLRQQFYDFLLEGKALPEMYLSPALGAAPHFLPQSKPSAVTIDPLPARLQLYELLQELHRLNSEIRVLCYTEPGLSLRADLEILPRLTFSEVELESAIGQPDDSQILVIYTLSRSPQKLLEKLQISPDFDLSRYDFLVLAGQITPNPGTKRLIKRYKFSPVQMFGQTESHCLAFKRVAQTSLRISTTNDASGWPAIKQALRKVKLRLKQVIPIK